MEIKEIQGAIEAVLFASGDPISTSRIAETFEITKNDVNKLMNILIDKFDNESFGMCIIKLDDCYQMISKSCYAEFIKKVLDIRRNIPLSQAAMEVLAVIAYNQPVTKSFVEQVRGIDSSKIVKNLCSKNLIEEKGRLELPGKPLLYGTTPTFLRCFGISSVSELPELPYKSENEDTPQ